MMSGGLAHHPAGNMRQRSIELMDDEHVSALKTLTPNNNHNVPAAGDVPLFVEIGGTGVAGW
jgi:hypothetical protein